jgi:hypothetical protein
MKTEEVAEDSTPLQFRRGPTVPGQSTQSTSTNAINRFRFGVLSRATSTSPPRTSTTTTISNPLEQRLTTAPLGIVSSPSRSTRIQSSSSSSRLADESAQASSRRQPRRGAKRSAQQQSQAENNNSSGSEDRTNTETYSTSRRVRRRMNSHSSSSSSTPQSQQLTTSTPFGTAERANH